MQRSGYHLADYLETAILRMNAVLFRFDLREDPADRGRFQADANALKSRLEKHRATAVSYRQRDLFEEIRSAFETYLNSAVGILEESAQTKGPGSTALYFDRIEKDSDRLLLLARRLAEAERELLQNDLKDAYKALSELKLLLAASLALLIVLSLSLAIIVWRGMIAPLTVKLIESRALLERQEKLASLGVLAAGVAHEIRNPLTAIKARLFTQRKLLPENSEAIEDNQFISEEMLRLDKIIKDFLMFARPSEPRFEILRATSPMREMCDLFRPELEKKSINLKCEFLADPQVKADSQQLKQVLINLIKNASESIGKSGTITLRTATRKARRIGQGATAVLEVEDTGDGISPAVEKRLFDPFFSTKEGGTGLGLSIAARILEKHGGSLEYRRQAPGGVVFSVILPIAKDHDR